MLRLALLLSLALAGCATPQPKAPHPAPATLAFDRTQPWPQASARFHASGAWLGADSAYSIPLGPLRVLWLFADTFLDRAADGSRENGPNDFIRNSVAIQSGPDPQRAHDLARSRLDFFWGPTRDGAPSSFFHDRDGSERWLWPLHGARLADGELLIFRMQVEHSAGGLGFEVSGWDAVAIDDADAPPDAWRPRVIANARPSFGTLIGSSVLVHGDYLYAYAVENQSQAHAIYLARFALRELAGLRAGALDDPEWFCAGRFVRQSAMAEHGQPSALFRDGQVEFSVHFDALEHRFLEVQMQGLFLADPHTQLAVRHADLPEGPWSALAPFYTPREHALPDAAELAAYAGKAHPEQLGADLVLTYVVNDLKHFPPSDALYYPQVLRVPRGTSASR